MYSSYFRISSFSRHLQLSLYHKLGSFIILPQVSRNNLLIRVMEVRPPQDRSPIPPSEYPQVPLRTSPGTAERLHSAYASHDIQTFRQILDSQISSSEDFEICDFSSIMIDAIELGNSDFIQELLRHGLHLSLTYAVDAIRVKNTRILDLFLENGLDLNEPMGGFRPPILG